MTSDRSLRHTFNSVASLYHRARPSYPSEIFKDIQDYSAINENSSLLEIGTGTGIATLPFAKLNCNITCLDSGKSLLEEAQRNLKDFPKVSFINDSFEDYNFEDQKFDLIFSATAFHWLDHEKAYPKISNLLNPQGTLAIFSYYHVAHATDSKFDKFFSDVQPLYVKYMESAKADEKLMPADTIASTLDETLSYGFFDNPISKRYLFTVNYTADQYINVLSTYSGHINLEENVRTEFFKEIRDLIDNKYEGNITKQYVTILDLVRVKD